MQTLEQLKQANAHYQKDELFYLFKFLRVSGAVLFLWGAFGLALTFLNIGSDYGYLAYKYFSYHARGMHLGIMVASLVMLSSERIYNILR